MYLHVSNGLCKRKGDRNPGQDDSNTSAGAGPLGLAKSRHSTTRYGIGDVRVYEARMGMTKGKKRGPGPRKSGVKVGGSKVIVRQALVTRSLDMSWGNRGKEGG